MLGFGGGLGRAVGGVAPEVSQYDPPSTETISRCVLLSERAII